MSLTINFYSVRDAFNDGNDKLHPAFCIRDTTFVLTRTRPRETIFVKVDPALIEGMHLKATSRSYLTVSYKENPQRFNNNPAGQLTLDMSITNFIRKFQPEVNLEEYCFKISPSPLKQLLMTTEFSKIRAAMDAAYGKNKFTTDEEIRTLLCLPSKISGKEVAPAEMIANMVNWSKSDRKEIAKNPALEARIYGGQIDGTPVKGFLPAMEDLWFSAGSINFAVNTADGKEDAFIDAITAEKAEFAKMYAEFVVTDDSSAIMEKYGEFFAATPEEVKAAVEAALEAETPETPLIINEEVDGTEAAPDVPADAPSTETEEVAIIPNQAGDEVIFTDTAATTAVMAYIGKGLEKDMELAQLASAAENIAIRTRAILKQRQQEAQELIQEYLSKASWTAQIFLNASQQVAQLPTNVEVPAETVAAE